MINSFLVKLWLLLNSDSSKKMKHIKTTRLYEEFILLTLEVGHQEYCQGTMSNTTLGTYGIAQVRAFYAKYYVFANKLTEKPSLKLI